MIEVEQKSYLDLSVLRRSIIDLRLLSLITALSFDHQVYFLMNIFGKRNDLPFFMQVRSQKGEKHGFVYACNQTQLNDFAHKQTLICRQLFAGHVVGFWPMTEKNNLYGSRILSVFFLGYPIRHCYHR